MKYLKIAIIFILSFVLISTNGNAATANSGVGTDMTASVCTSNYQDNSIRTSGQTYFSRCMKATCSNGSYNLNYYSSNSVTCSNGNSNPYYKIYKNGCTKYSTSVCNRGDTKYCSMILYYDCTRKINGESFTTTRKTTTTTTRKNTYKPTTTTTTSKVIVNTKLSSLSFSNGSISFNPDVYVYDLNVDSSVTSINVNAIPQDTSSKVEVSGNTNITNGSQITIIVTGIDGSYSEYKVNVTLNKVVELSSNTKLKSLTVDNYVIPFSSNINSYSLTVDSGVSDLVINCETEESKSTFVIEGNKNIKNGDKITITVTAEDGSVGYYYINVTVKKKSSFLPVMFVIILILALLAGGYYIYKKFISNKGDDKYEYE